MSKKSTSSAYLEFQLIGFYTENIFEKIDLDADITKNSGEFDVDDDAEVI